MCGNFGLLSLAKRKNNPLESSTHHSVHEFQKSKVSNDILDISLNNSMHQVSKLNGINFKRSEFYETNGNDLNEFGRKEQTLPLIKILESQTANTEIRGGQAGGFSSIEFEVKNSNNNSIFSKRSVFSSNSVIVSKMNRVRMVARKRHPLAADLSKKYLSSRFGIQPNANNTLSVIGHTRFSTSSINVEPELHPHEWVPFHEESVWLFDSKNGKYEKQTTSVGIHLTHNGDFDALESYSQSIVSDELGFWLERVLNVPNILKCDSIKLAGCMDLLRVQGRWSASARLAWVRCVLTSCLDVSGGSQLCSTAPNSFPTEDYWASWASFFETYWSGHINNIVKLDDRKTFDIEKHHTYSIDRKGVKQLENCLYQELVCAENGYLEKFDISNWSQLQMKSFIHSTIRGFLYADLYNALIELMSRAEGSFGVQVHCSIEPGVVVIASKGQPMSLAFDPSLSIVLFGSEAEALSVPIFESGKWLSLRLDLDSHGEIIRIGEPRALNEGSFNSSLNSKKSTKTKIGESEINQDINSPFKHNSSNQLDSPFSSPTKGSHIREDDLSIELAPFPKYNSKNNKDNEALFNELPYFLLDSGVEFKSYSLASASELKRIDFIKRSVPIESSPIPYDPRKDLVDADLKIIPAVISAIDGAWANTKSVESISGASLAKTLVKSMQRRIESNKDTIDLIVSGIEASLWLAEQFSADVKRIFPHLNVVATSSNKLMGLGDDNPNKVFFPGADEIPLRKVDKNTCILLISQSGQTFSTLHATRKMTKIAYKYIWIMTGCFNSKMEQALVEGYKEKKKIYGKNRVFNNYSGNRPAEPSSVAVVATWHSLTKLIMCIIQMTRKRLPMGRLLQPWEYKQFARTIQSFFLRANYISKMQKQSVLSGKPSMKAKKKPALQASNLSLATTGSTSKGQNFSSRPTSEIIMNLSDGCIEDICSLLNENLILNLSRIVGHDALGRKLGKNRDDSEISYHSLVKQGKAWADHINEPWNIMIAAGAYIFFSVFFGIPLFGLLGDAIAAIIRAAGADIGHGLLAFTPRFPHVIYDQPIGWTLVGLFIQMLDAIFYVFVGKQFTRASRILFNRPLAARHGKRTLVIVDTPCVHQLLEAFVSKLFAQSYSMVSIDVHGASGLDHFVHRFTHRVSRGVLLAMGRPDGRLCCLAKSEASIILAAKQAAFIRNPDYKWEGSGPEIVTVGHNPFIPNLGLAHHITLHEGAHDTFQSLDANIDGSVTGKPVNLNYNRRKFVDEYLYDRLYLAKKPFSTSILRALRRAMSEKSTVIYSKSPNFNLNSSVHSVSNHHHKFFEKKQHSYDIPDEPLPYGVHHIDPSILEKSTKIESSVFADFVFATKDILRSKFIGTDVNQIKMKSYDPANRLAFFTKLDSQTRQIQDKQVNVQQFYECRVASLERFVAFCVMFHAMASNCSRPWFLVPWDIARSQSNLRVATTASPISAGLGSEDAHSNEVKKIAHQLLFKLKGTFTNF